MNEMTGSPARTTDQPQGVAGVASDRAGNVASQASEQAKVVARDAKEHARDLLQRARHDVEVQAEQRSGQAAASLRSLAGQLGALADGDAANAGVLGDYARDARDRVERFASRMDEGPQAVMADVRSFARSKPLVFLGLAGALGFAAGRFARASSGSDSGQSAGELAPPAGATYATPVVPVTGTVGDPFVDPTGVEPALTGQYGTNPPRTVEPPVDVPPGTYTGGRP